MVKQTEIIDFLNTVAPPQLAESYDNVGLLLGERQKNVQKVLVTLDVDEMVAKEAKALGADMILSHHPLIFAPLKRITGEDGTSKTIMELLKHDISLVSMHTNFDSVKSGLGDAFLDAFADTTHRVALDGDEENGIGRIADMREPIVFSALLANIQKAFGTSTLRYIGDEKKMISKIAAVNGGGAEYIYAAKEQNADCFVSGDIKYHQARFAYENNIALVEVPHYNAEIIFCSMMKNLLKKQFGDCLTIFETKANSDIWKQMDSLV